MRTTGQEVERANRCSTTASEGPKLHVDVISVVDDEQPLFSAIVTQLLLHNTVYVCCQLFEYREVQLLAKINKCIVDHSKAECWDSEDRAAWQLVIHAICHLEYNLRLADHVQADNGSLRDVACVRKIAFNFGQESAALDEA